MTSIAIRFCLLAHRPPQSSKLRRHQGKHDGDCRPLQKRQRVDGPLVLVPKMQRQSAYSDAMPSAFDLWPFAFGVRPSAHGLRPAACGLRPVACGLWPSACGLRPAACGLRPTAYGLRPSASLIKICWAYRHGYIGGLNSLWPLIHFR